MENGKRPALGQPVKVRAEFFRTSDPWWKKYHKRIEYKIPVEGIYIGQRVVQDGITETDEGYMYFVPQKWHKVWLVVTNEFQNPIRCLPEDVEPSTASGTTAE